MGSGVSLPPLTNASDLPPDDAIKYAKRYQIKPNELRYIFRRFHVLCKTNGRSLVPGDVPRTASLLKHDLSKRVISLMARSSKGGGVNFEAFLQTYKIFRTGQPLGAKLQFAFDVFDQDGDGRLSYLELCQMVQLLRPELQAPQIAQVAKDFMIFAFECADRSSIGNPEDECLEFPEFFAVASQIPGVGHALSVDVSAVFEAEKAAILSNLAAGEAKQAEPDAADKKAKKADAKSE